MHGTWWVAVVVTALVPGPMIAAQDSVQPDVIQLRFAWPPALHATVDAIRYQVRTADGRTDSTTAAFTYEMIAEPQREGLLVRTLDFALGSETNSGDGASLQAISEQLQGLTPGLIVNHAGELVALDDVSTVRERLLAIMTPLLDSLPSQAQPQVRQLFQTLTAPEYLLAKSREDWNAAVGMWAGADFEIGAVYGSEGEEPTPLFPDRMISFVYEFTAVERVPCVDGASDRACVVLEMTSYPDPEALARLVEGLVEEVTTGAAPDVVYEKLEVENWIQLITEPNTLIPHHLTIVQTIDGTVRASGEPPAQFGQTRGREYRYTYPHR